MRYPQARISDHTDILHGNTVADPYRWMEDIDSEETRAWIKAQNALTQSFLDKVPMREQIQQRMTELWDYEKFGVPEQHAGRVFYTYNTGLENQDVLYWMKDMAGDAQVLLDPNALSEDGTSALTGYAISNNGKYLAYAISDAGSDWQEWFVRRVDDAQDMPDQLRWVKFSSASWDKNDTGFYYSRYDAPTEGDLLKKTNYYQKLYYHKLGTDQSEDVLVYERPDQPEWGFHGVVTEDGNYLVIIVTIGTLDEVCIFYQDISQPDQSVVELLNRFDAEYELVANQGSLFYFLTTYQAPLRRLIAINITRPDPEHWHEIIPEGADALEVVSLLDEKFACQVLNDAVNQVRIVDMQGKLLGSVDLPGLGTVYGFRGKSTDTETFYAYTDITTPQCIYHFDLQSLKSTIFRSPRLVFDPQQYTTERVFVTSKDGTKVPVFISHKKGLQKNGDLPTYLFGYGGFNISIPVMFKVPNLVWMELGGVYAQVQLRGGSEYGEAWHHAGTKANKQNVFDDFIATAEWLIASGYTRPSKLAIGGRSNGGLLMGAVLTQRPNLFGVVMPTVGVMDMLRFHKFTIGWAWVSDYGSPDDPEEFKAIYAYSPYHNIQSGTCYPPTMITTGDHDDRVFPAHSYKFAARLQASQGCETPILIRIDARAGHGVGKPTAKLIEESADLWAFTLANLK